MICSLRTHQQPAAGLLLIYEVMRLNRYDSRFPASRTRFIQTPIKSQNLWDLHLRKDRQNRTVVILSYRPAHYR